MPSDCPQVWRTERPKWFLKDGAEVPLPPGWEFVPSGDPALTRRLKASGECWCVVHRRRNRVESVGLLTDAARVETLRAQLEREHADPAYQRKLDAARKRREEKQNAYEEEFFLAVLDFLDFAPRYGEMALAMARAVTAHAVPVGSGTVARTTRIPVAQRAESAVIAWMRHQTTAYDQMDIARVKGERRRVRRMLAERSRTLLERYRKGTPIDFTVCPLARALSTLDARTGTQP